MAVSVSQDLGQKTQFQWELSRYLFGCIYLGIGVTCEDFEMDTLNDLFTQWLPVTLLITGTIDKRAPQPHINDLRACGFTNGLVLFFLYLGTFLFGAWGARAVLFALTPAAKELAQVGGGPLALAKAGAGMMYFAMPALFVSVFPFMVNLVHKADIGFQFSVSKMIQNDQEQGPRNFRKPSKLVIQCSVRPFCTS